MKTSGADRAHPNASTGPRSAAGKARSSMNALKSGIYSKSLVIPGEEPGHLDTLLDEYLQRFHPAVPEQRDLVDILVRSTWTLRRLATAEAQVFIYQMDTAYKLNQEAPLGHAFQNADRTLSRLQRMVNSTQRNYRDALRELQRLQSLDQPAAPNPAAVQATPQPAETEPVSSSPQFVSSSSSAPLPPAPPPAARKPLPFHLPGHHCGFTPLERLKYKQCPTCFPPQDPSDAPE